jgi:hypothetical protein
MYLAVNLAVNLAVERSRRVAIIESEVDECLVLSESVSG